MNDSLAHFGILGMKWGRRGESTTNKSTKKPKSYLAMMNEHRTTITIGTYAAVALVMMFKYDSVMNHLVGDLKPSTSINNNSAADAAMRLIKQRLANG